MDLLATLTSVRGARESGREARPQGLGQLLMQTSVARPREGPAKRGVKISGAM